MCMYVYVYIYIHICILCMYIYICIYIYDTNQETLSKVFKRSCSSRNMMKHLHPNQLIRVIHLLFISFGICKTSQIQPWAAGVIHFQRFTNFMQQHSFSVCEKEMYPEDNAIYGHVHEESDIQSTIRFAFFSLAIKARPVEKSKDWRRQTGRKRQQGVSCTTRICIEPFLISSQHR